MSRAVRRQSNSPLEYQAPWSDEELIERLRGLPFIRAPHKHLVLCPGCHQGIAYRFLSGWDNCAIELTKHQNPAHWNSCDMSLATFSIEAWQVRLV